MGTDEDNGTGSNSAVISRASAHFAVSACREPGSAVGRSRRTALHFRLGREVQIRGGRRPSTGQSLLPSIIRRSKAHHGKKEPSRTQHPTPPVWASYRQLISSAVSEPKRANSD